MPPTPEVNESLLINSWLTVSSAVLIVLFFNLCVVREKKNEKKKKEISKSCSVKDLLTAFHGKTFTWHASSIVLQLRSALS